MANVRTNFSTKNDFDVNNGTEGPAGDPTMKFFFSCLKFGFTGLAGCNPTVYKGNQKAKSTTLARASVGSLHSQYWGCCIWLQ